MRMIVVLIHHRVDGGWQGTRLFRTRDAAETWLGQSGYRRPDPDDTETWTKPVYSEWDAEEYVACPEALEMETAQVYEQEVEP